MFNLKGKSIVFVMVLSLISQVSAVTVSAATLTLNSIAKVDTNNYKINDLEVEGLDEATMVAVSVDKGYFKVTENSSLYSVNYDILPEHKSVIIIFNNKLSMSQVKSILQNNITYTVNNGETQKVSIKISNNDTKIPNEATVTMKDSNGIMHYYIYVNNLSEISWINAYNNAKEYKLDGLKGYLATITSKEEDDVLKSISTCGAWSGGTRLLFNESYDSDRLTIKSYGENFAWACGPEKGQVYYEGKNNGINRYGNKGNGVSWGWKEGVPNEPNNLYNEETCMQVNFDEKRYWNDLKYNDETISGFFVEFSSYGDNVGDSSKRISATRTTTQASLRDKEELKINDIGFNYIDRKLTKLTNGKYSVDGNIVNITDGCLDISDKLGKSITLIKCGDGVKTIDSDPVIINIKDKIPESNVTYNIKQPTYVTKTGTLNIPDTEEYSVDEGKTWLSGTGKNIENLKPDCEVYIRTKATKNSLESNAVKVKIKALPEREVISKESVTINDFNEKSADNSSNKTVRNKIKTSDTAPIASLSVIALLSGLVAFIKRKKI